MADHSSHLPPRTPAAAQPPAPYRPTPDEAELIRLSQEWMEIALVEKDEQRLRCLVAPQFTLQIWDASRAAQGLDSWMQVLLHRLADIELTYTSLSAQVFGSIGVVYSTFWWTGTMDGQPFADSGFMTDIWSRESGSWRVVSRRSAPQQQIQRLRAL
jgi:hypothetical protein